MLILNCEQTRKLEQSAVDNGCTYLGLMERAGREAAAFIQQALFQQRLHNVQRDPVIALAFKLLLSQLH